MYSAVLMLALTAGGESVDFGRNRCHGCSTSCTATAAKTCTTSTKSSCASSCSRERHRLFGNRCHGCSASTSCTKTVVAAPACTKSHGCSTSHGCRGGLFSRRDRGCHGATTCAATCTSGTKKEMPKGEKVAPPKGDKKPVAAPATIVVSIPAGARLIVDGAPTTSTSEVRTLVTPELEFGMTYVYTMQAEVVRNGQTLAQAQQVTVRGGETSAVQFNFSTQGVASR